MKLLALLTVLTTSLHAATPQIPDRETLIAKNARLTPVDIEADVSKLSAGDRKALPKLVSAARLLDAVFQRQVWQGNPKIKELLEKSRGPLAEARLKAFQINAGPWSRLDDDAPFIPPMQFRFPATKPETAGYYPSDLTKIEFQRWVGTLEEADKAKATGFFWLVRRGDDGKLSLEPYSTAYRKWLEPAAQLLREAAVLTQNPSLRKYLTLRADAFLSDEYYASDIAWMELDAPLDVTIGPYETYEDKLFGYKAAFEAFITVRDAKETAKLAKFSAELQNIENNLPIDEKYRNPKIGAQAPIRVVDEVFTAGEARRGVHTAAFNLPNDEKVIQEKGSKRVMLKNVQEAKFNKILLPITNIALAVPDAKTVTFDAFFTHILMHELVHGLGPHEITVNGRATTPRQELQDLYGAIEEAKADITGLFAMQYLIDKGVLDKTYEDSMYNTFLASVFRSVRFGLGEAHGKGIAMQFNYLIEKGAFKQTQGFVTYFVDKTKIKSGVRDLTKELLMIQAEGNYKRAKEMLDKYGVISPGMTRVLDRLKKLPVDIDPNFKTVETTKAE